MSDDALGENVLGLHVEPALFRLRDGGRWEAFVATMAAETVRRLGGLLAA